MSRPEWIALENQLRRNGHKRQANAIQNSLNRKPEAYFPEPTLRFKDGSIAKIDHALEQIDFVDELAAFEHDSWARWQDYLHSRCIVNEDGSLTIPAELVERWKRQIETPYYDLTEQEKESDRTEVRRFLHIVRRTSDEVRNL